MRIACGEFEDRLDEFASGTLPDTERSAMREHRDRCPACRELEEGAEAIIRAAREEGLDVPGDAWFADLALRLEDRLDAEGALSERLRRRRLAPLIHLSQGTAATAALLAISLWLNGAAVAAGIRPPEREREVAALSASVDAADVSLARDRIDERRRIEAKLMKLYNLI